MSIDVAALGAPFPVASVSWRVGNTSSDKTRGMALAYIDARDVMRRLDEVVGPCNWKNEFGMVGNRLVCTIYVRCGTDWVGKTDGAGDTDVEPEKGGLSDAFKRAAVHWGIGRYLYDLDSPWVELVAAGKSYRIKDSEYAKLRECLSKHAKPAKPVEQPPTKPTPITGKQIDDINALILATSTEEAKAALWASGNRVNDVASLSHDEATCLIVMLKKKASAATTN